MALSEAEVHWRAFLESLVQRGMRGVQFIVSDDHAGLRAARRAVLGGAVWQRCQFHLAQNAIHHAPNAATRKRIGAQLRSIWNADTADKAQAELNALVASYRDTAPKLAAWLEENVPEGLAVFALPEHHRRRMRTSNPMERGIQQELKRRTVKIRVFPGEASLLRCASPPPYSSRSTKNGPQKTRPTSSGSARMADYPKSEFPDLRLHNHRRLSRQ